PELRSLTQRLGAEARLTSRRKCRAQQFRRFSRSMPFGAPHACGLRQSIDQRGIRKIMGQIVAAMATVHAPQLFTRPPTEDPAQLDADIAAMRELGRTLDETRPDAVIVIGSDHLETFFLSSVPTFAIVAGETSKAKFAGRDYNLPIHSPLAEDLLDRLVRADFDMAYSQDAVLGHS